MTDREQEALAAAERAIPHFDVRTYKVKHFIQGYLAALDAHRPTEPDEDATRIEFVDERATACVEAWPGCASGEYDPRCCRFPKSCSAGIVRAVTPRGEQP